MYINPMISLVLLGLTLSSAVVSTVASDEPRESATHKLVRRGRHGGRGGSGGEGGRSMLRTVAGGTALAGGAMFAGTAGSIAAHKLFDHDDQDRRDEGKHHLHQHHQEQEQEQAAAVQYPTRGFKTHNEVQVHPIAILMSDGSYRAIHDDDENGGQARQSQKPFANDAVNRDQQQAQGQDQNHPANGGNSGESGPFVFPPPN